MVAIIDVNRRWVTRDIPQWVIDKKYEDERLEKEVRMVRPIEEMDNYWSKVSPSKIRKVIFISEDLSVHEEEINQDTIGTIIEFFEDVEECMNG